MSQNDEVIITKIGTAVRAAMVAKDSMRDSIAEAIDASTTFGYELGAEDYKLKAIEALGSTGDARAEWAISILASMEK